MANDNGDIINLPHHQQQELCTTRLPYRQGRKLTAVKVYTIINESNHLLIFGVPSLNLRQEAKSLFSKFGKLLQFSQTKNHPCELFTETYHAQYEKIQSARIAKRMLDTKNFYGGSLHVCYAPEFETIQETQSKLLQRKRDVIFRLRNIHNDVNKTNDTDIKSANDNNIENDISNTNDKSNNDAQYVRKVNMGDVNTIVFNNESIVGINKRKIIEQSEVKRFKPCFIADEIIYNDKKTNDDGKQVNSGNVNKTKVETCISKNNDNRNEINDVEIIDCTSVDRETITNVDDILNYNKFGNEVVRIVPQKPVNKINFNITNNNS